MLVHMQCSGNVNDLSPEMIIPNETTTSSFSAESTPEDKYRIPVNLLLSRFIWPWPPSPLHCIAAGTVPKTPCPYLALPYLTLPYLTCLYSSDQPTDGNPSTLSFIPYPTLAYLTLPYLKLHPSVPKNKKASRPFKRPTYLPPHLQHALPRLLLLLFPNNTLGRGFRCRPRAVG